MCGIAGFWKKQSRDLEADQRNLGTMSARLSHRGPDSEGSWSDSASGIFFGHRRLAVLELSGLGAQPMTSRDGRYVLIFNGEIYNHKNLRFELAGTHQAWSGESDTETLLAGIEVWGILETLKKSVGMFALALWDKEMKSLVLSRDRMGEKPLYYAQTSEGVYFSSELKSLKSHSDLRHLGIESESVELLLRYGYIPSPYSIYQNTYKLSPGVILEFSEAGKLQREIKYWDAEEIARKGMESPFKGTFEDACRVVEAELEKSIRRQLISDVPIGAFLSGGVDSSLIASMMQKMSSTPIQTFTIGFENPKYNEANEAKKIAQHLKTNHHELYFTAEHVKEIIPKLPQIYCEPFSDNSQLPTTLLAQMTRKHVTVALSGDGGDELFGGYRRYLTTIQAMKFLRFNTTEKKLFMIGFNLLSLFNIKTPPSHEYLDCKNFTDLYHRRFSNWWQKPRLMLHKKEPHFADVYLEKQIPEGLDNYQTMMYIDQKTYLPDCILTKVDRAAMAFGLETRAPFLGQAVVELAWAMPSQYKINAKTGKLILRKILQDHLPDDVSQRQKKGFGVPLAQWLRGDLKDWAQDLLAVDLIKRGGYFDSKSVQLLWKEHLAGEDRSKVLWNILMFQSWQLANE